MEGSLENIRVHDKGVNGCIRHKKDIMLSFQLEGDKSTNGLKDIHDIFLTTNQAEELLEGLKQKLETNKTI